MEASVNQKSNIVYLYLHSDIMELTFQTALVQVDKRFSWLNDVFDMVKFNKRGLVSISDTIRESSDK